MSDHRRTLDLFGDTALPQGFRYQPEFLSRGEERSLLQYIEKLPFREFEFMASPESGGSCHSDDGMISTEAD